MLVRLLVEVDMSSVFPIILVSNVKITSNQCYTLYVTSLRIVIHTLEKPYDKSVHTGEEPYIYDFIIVSLINKPGSQK